MISEGKITKLHLEKLQNRGWKSRCELRKQDRKCEELSRYKTICKLVSTLTYERNSEIHRNTYFGTHHKDNKDD